MIITSIIAIITMYALYCYTSCARTYPRNFVLLFLFTFCEAFSLCYLVILSKDDNVVIAFGMTCAIVVGLTCYAFYTKTDFTYCGGLFFMLLLGSIGFAILAAIF